MNKIKKIIVPAIVLILIIVLGVVIYIRNTEKKCVADYNMPSMDMVQYKVQEMGYETYVSTSSITGIEELTFFVDLWSDKPNFLFGCYDIYPSMESVNSLIRQIRELAVEYKENGAVDGDVIFAEDEKNSKYYLIIRGDIAQGDFSLIPSEMLNGQSESHYRYWVIYIQNNQVFEMGIYDKQGITELETLCNKLNLPLE